MGSMQKIRKEDRSRARPLANPFLWRRNELMKTIRARWAGFLGGGALLLGSVLGILGPASGQPADGSAAPILVAKGGHNSGGHNGGHNGGGGQHNGGGSHGNGSSGGGSGAAGSRLAGYAATEAIVFKDLDPKAATLHATVDAQTQTLPLVSPSVALFDATGQPAPASRLKAGQNVEAILYDIDGKPTVCALRSSNAVVFMQKSLKVYGANSSEEIVTLLEQSHGSLKFPTDNAVIIDASGARKRFSDIRVGSTVEVVWKDSPGDPSLVLMKI
jgi:hypothetical protein